MKSWEKYVIQEENKGEIFTMEIPLGDGIS